MNMVKMDREYYRWFNHYLPILEVEDTCGLVMLSDEGKPMAGAVFDNLTDNSAQVHLLLRNPRALKYGFFHICANFIFFHMDKKYVYGQIPGNNTKALKFNLRMGFRTRLRLKDAFKDGVDYVIMEHTREDYMRMFPQEVKHG